MVPEAALPKRSGESKKADVAMAAVAAGGIDAAPFLGWRKEGRKEGRREGGREAFFVCD